MSRISVDSLVKEFHLPRAIAADILARERVRAMRSHWQCWLASLGLFVVPALLPELFGLHTGGWVIAGACTVVQSVNPLVVNRHAAPAVRKAAREKAQRLAGHERSDHPWPAWRV